MARPKKEGLEYFPHDVDLSGDEKVEALEAHYGLEGYAVYLKLLERIYRGGGQLELTDDLKLVLGKKWGLSGTRLDELISYSVQINLFSFKNSILTSKGVKKRVQVVNAKRLKWRRKKKDEKFSPEKNIGKLEENPTKESKVKESKVKEIKEKSIKEKKAYGEFQNVFLTDGEIKKLKAGFGEKKALEFIERLSSGIASKGYKYKSHYATILTWNRKDESQGALQRPTEYEQGLETLKKFAEGDNDKRDVCEGDSNPKSLRGEIRDG